MMRATWDVLQHSTHQWLEIPPAMRGHWFALHTWCALHETGGVLIGAAAWPMWKWKQICGPRFVPRTIQTLIKMKLIGSIDDQSYALSAYDRQGEDWAKIRRAAAAKAAKSRWSGYASRIADRTAERIADRIAPRDASSSSSSADPPQPPLTGGIPAGKLESARDLLQDAWSDDATYKPDRVGRALADLAQQIRGQPPVELIADRMRICRADRDWLAKNPRATAASFIRSGAWKVAPRKPPRRRGGERESWDLSPAERERIRKSGWSQANGAT